MWVRVADSKVWEGGRGGEGGEYELWYVIYGVIHVHTILKTSIEVHFLEQLKESIKWTMQG